jgi:hypothetical protein
MTRERHWRAGDKLPPPADQESDDLQRRYRRASHAPPEDLFPLEVRPADLERRSRYERALGWISTGLMLVVASLALIAWGVLWWKP